ncbi:MAG: hypothetical protein K1060chlam3_00295 [Candidatus Anoxychlamydiales bacterium]|nr:hypothetical protein [Candidatus Anoxychlamydiales bacterium]
MSSSSVSEVSSHSFKFETTKEGLRKRQAELEKTEKKTRDIYDKKLREENPEALVLKKQMEDTDNELKNINKINKLKMKKKSMKEAAKSIKNCCCCCSAVSIVIIIALGGLFLYR